MATNDHIKGGCLCGAVRFDISTLPTDAGYCHCRNCQISSGGPAIVWAEVAVKDITFTKAQAKAYKSSETGRRNFCGECGSQLFFQDTSEPDYLYIHTGCLDEPSRVPPKMHIWTKSQVSWLNIHDDLPTYVKDVDEE